MWLLLLLSVRRIWHRLHTPNHGNNRHFKGRFDVIRLPTGDACRAGPCRLDGHVHGRLHLQMGRRQESGRVPQRRLHDDPREFELGNSSAGPAGQPAGRPGQPGLLLCRPHQFAAHLFTQLQPDAGGEGRVSRSQHNGGSGPLSQPAAALQPGNVQHQREAALALAESQSAGQAGSPPVSRLAQPAQPRTSQMPTGNGGQEGVYASEQVGEPQTVGQSIHQPQTGSLFAAQQAQKPRLAGQPVELRLPPTGPARLPV